MAHTHAADFKALRIAVLTVSDTRDLSTDSSGQLLADALATAGHQLADRAIVRDDIWQIRARVCPWIAATDVEVILITGGTGFAQRDVTPQAISPLIERSVDGFGELFRHISFSDIGLSTMQSRALAGISNGTLICALPGSTNACRTAWEGILLSQLDNRTRPCNFVPHLGSPQHPAAPLCDTRG
ncbi:MAG: molybdenum cofactor biosynthesis protein B [Moraxellaceae bacterium]|nr:molybdenum cofactor biosynthesis protein B [Moraxellaceae bacterium]